MSEQAVLYDAPGPRARRITLVSSVVAAVAVLVAAYYFMYLPLDRADQLTMEKWGPLIDPSNENFQPLWKRLLEGFQATLMAAAAAIVSSLLVGTALAVLRLQLKALSRRRFTGLAAPLAVLVRTVIVVLNVVTRFFVEIFRGIPVVITIFFVWVYLSQIGVTFDNLMWYLVIGLTIYNSVVIGEILRSGMEGLPPGQREAADALGLTAFQRTRLILLPQAFRIMMPALISQLVVVLKDTSLGFIITYEEIMRVSNQTIQFLGNTIQTFIVVGAIYIGLNYGLSKLAGYVQRRMARAKKVPTAPDAHPPAALSAEAQAVVVTSETAAHHRH